MKVRRSKPFTEPIPETADEQAERHRKWRLATLNDILNSACLQADELDLPKSFTEPLWKAFFELQTKL